MYLPFVLMEELHAKNGNDPADDLDDDDSDYDGHAAAIDGGEHLPADDGIDGAVAELWIFSDRSR